MALTETHVPLDDADEIGHVRDNIAYAVKMLMAHRGGLTQAKLADALGFSGSQFTERMKGRTPWRDVDFIRLGRRLGIPANAFLLPPDEFRVVLQALGYMNEVAGERQLSLAFSAGRRRDDDRPVQHPLLRPVEPVK